MTTEDVLDLAKQDNGKNRWQLYEKYKKMVGWIENYDDFIKKLCAILGI